MKLKEWNSLNEETRTNIARIMFALEGEEKIEKMSRIWRHNIDDDHRKLVKNVIMREDGSITVKVNL